MGLNVVKGRLYCQFVIDGQRYSVATGLEDTPRNRSKALETEALEKAKIRSGAEREKKVLARRFVDAAPEFIAWAKSEYRTKENTWKRISTSMTSLTHFFKTKMIAAVDEGAIEAYMEWRRTGDPAEKIRPVEEVTLRHDIHNLSLFFQWARKRHFARRNPVDAENIAIPSDKDAVREHIFSIDEERRYFAVATRNSNLHDTGRLMINQGFRPEEVWSLEKRGFDIEARTAKVFDGKSAAAKRTLNLTGEAYTILMRRLPGDSPWFFPSKKRPGRHITKLNNPHQRVLAKIKLNADLYDFRHTFATRAGQSGMDIKTLADILGHASLRTVARYIHPTDAHKKASMDRLKAYNAMQTAAVDEAAKKSAAPKRKRAIR